ncbi:Flp family type IVb pilin [Thermorudis peleae]|uniref:Flp family type IVb pilin n=1 Tax=Thermorudis peleae TaxID=1382356 RepID=UPI000690F48A|nr:Flp family type IVb pilin [Thermorudis peleae]
MLDYLKALYGLYVPEDVFEGQGLVEYALILALVAIVAIAALITLGTKVQGVFNKINNSLPS